MHPTSVMHQPEGVLMANFLIRTGLSVVLGLSGIAIGHCSTPSVTTIPQSERNVLTALFLSTDGGGWTDSTNWCDKTRCSSGPKFDSPGTECTWFGVTCDGSGAHVTRIALNDNQLSGQIPDLGDLTELVSFDVSGNRLFGAIPTLAGAQKLATFDVGHNQLSGPLPALNQLPSLKVFVAADNRLSGSVPDLQDLVSLIAFDIGHNQLTGHAPAPPSSNSLRLGLSNLCPNYLSALGSLRATTNLVWDDATGSTPWTVGCDTETVFRGTFDG